MELDQLYTLAEQDDIDAILELGNHYWNLDTIADGKVALELYERAAEKGSTSGIYSSMAARNVFAQTEENHNLDEAYDHWKTANKWAKMLLTDRKNELEPEGVEAAERILDKSAYWMASYLWVTDDVKSAFTAVQDAKGEKAQLLRGLCRFDMTRIDSETLGVDKSLIEFFTAIQEMLEVLRSRTYIRRVKDLEGLEDGLINVKEELIYAKAAQYVEAFYRDGVPGMVPKNTELAVEILQTAIDSIENLVFKAPLEETLRHYKKKLFGGYTYVP